MRNREDINTILEAALTVFAEYGYKKATVEDIAGALGMTKGNLYHYVKGKRELYEKTAAFALLRWQGQVVSAMEGCGGPRERFETMCRAAVRYLAHDERMRRLLKNDPDIFPMFPVNDPYADINRASVAMIASVLEDGIEKGAFHPADAGQTAEAIFSVYKMLVIRSYIHAEENEMWTAFEAILHLFTRGLYRHSPDPEPTKEAV